MKVICVFCKKFTRSRWTVCLSCAPYRNECAGKNLEGREMTRALVRARDKYTCQRCGTIRTREQVSLYNSKIKKGTLRGRMHSLDVHHKGGFCGKKSQGYDKMIDIPNLVTLCHYCHYNNHDFSKKQFGVTGQGKRLFSRSSMINFIKQGVSRKNIAESFGVSRTAITKAISAELENKKA